MYLNPIYISFDGGKAIIEPTHIMYLNSKKLNIPSDPLVIEPTHIMYLNVVSTLKVSCVVYRTDTYHVFKL